MQVHLCCYVYAGHLDGQHQDTQQQAILGYVLSTQPLPMHPGQIPRACMHQPGSLSLRIAPKLESSRERVKESANCSVKIPVLARLAPFKRFPVQAANERLVGTRDSSSEHRQTVLHMWELGVVAQHQPSTFPLISAGCGVYQV